MSRALLVVAVAVAAVLPGSGCGHGGAAVVTQTISTAPGITVVAFHADEAPPAAGCLVKIYFVRTATVAEIEAVGRRLAQNADVLRIAFVSKQQALAIMRKKYPDLVKHLSYNPLPHSYEIRPRYRSSPPRLLKSLSPRPAGVQKVDWGPSCA